MKFINVFLNREPHVVIPLLNNRCQQVFWGCFLSVIYYATNQHPEMEALIAGTTFMSLATSNNPSITEGEPPTLHPLN